MTTVSILTSWRRRRLLTKVMNAYVSWREQCLGVRIAYSHWVSAHDREAGIWYTAYADALDREQRASELYASLIRRAGIRFTGDVEPVEALFAAAGPQ
ncbi:MAG TPA: hypothetical protein VMP89_08740 [Solirubrobacteraceae bacterium]|nr:hypothetical protein [Solirubrobacteraceae bacterium]